MNLRRLMSLAAGLALVWLPQAILAQANPSLSAAERGITDGAADDEQHLRIDELKLDAVIAGRTADVTLELLIGTDNDKNGSFYEAKLALIMPADAVVTGYALDVDGKLIPGQLLEQPKARNVYEDQVRKGIDPGLAEVTSDNRFTTRIFPVAAQHPRRFRVSFSAPFDPEKGLVLPLMRAAVIGKIEATVTLGGYATPPDLRFAGMPMTLAKGIGGLTGNFRADKSSLISGLTVSGGTLANPLTIAHHASGEDFFVISDTTNVQFAPPKVGGRLRIYWDRSLSHGDDRLELETEALAMLAERTAPVAIDLVTFASDRPQVTTVTSASALRQALHGVTYRGGTSLARLDSLPLAPANDCVMVFDGQVTIDRAAEFDPDCRLSVITTSPGADGPRLGRMAQRTGGVFARLAQSEKAEDVAERLAQRAVTVQSVRDDSGRKLDFRALSAPAGGWLLVGPMPESGHLTVRINGGRDRHYDSTGASVPSAAPAALWAAQKLVDLGDDPARHKVMAAMARRYSVAGPAMAFLVLESPRQYLDADIAPPRGFTDEWMTEYRSEKNGADAGKANAKRDRFTFVLKQWQERKAWWGKTFISRKRAPKDRPIGPMAPPPPPMMVAAPALRMPPAPVSPIATAGNNPRGNRDSSDEGAANIIVTATAMPTVPPVHDRGTGESRAIKLDLADLTAKRPYIDALAAASPVSRLKVLDDQQDKYGTVPTFYLDTAEWFRLMGDTATADLLLLSALELPTSDDETRQIVAFRLERDKAYDRAVELAERLASANAEFRPQPGRDLALALAARGRARGAAGRADLERAFELLTSAALNPASDDFDGIEAIALMEANALIPQIEAAGGAWELDKRLVALLDTDVRIIIEWTADDADIDLWVDEPNGERVYYGDKQSSAGGQISNDMTDGYGPEEYAIHRAPAGSYAVRINGYDADRINPNGPGHVLIRLTRNFARGSEEQVLVDADLSFQKGRNRDAEGETKPVAILHVGK